MGEHKNEYLLNFFFFYSCFVFSLFCRNFVFLFFNLNPIFDFAFIFALAKSHLKYSISWKLGRFFFVKQFTACLTHLPLHLGDEDIYCFFLLRSSTPLGYMANSKAKSASGYSIPNVLLKSILRKDANHLNICHVNGGAISSDKIVFSETWLKSYRSNASVGIEGFDILRNDRQRIRSGGVAVYIRKGLKAKVIKVSSGIKSEFHFLEIIFPNSKLLIGAYYKAPRVDEIDLFDEALADVVTNYTDVITAKNHLKSNCVQNRKFSFYWNGASETTIYFN